MGWCVCQKSKYRKCIHHRCEKKHCHAVLSLCTPLCGLMLSYNVTACRTKTGNYRQHDYHLMYMHLYVYMCGSVRIKSLLIKLWATFLKAFGQCVDVCWPEAKKTLLSQLLHDLQVQLTVCCALSDHTHTTIIVSLSLSISPSHTHIHC